MNNTLSPFLFLAVWELYTSERIFDESVSIGQVYYMIAYEGWRPPIPEGCPAGYIQLMTACWAADPDQRPSAGEVADQLNELYAAEKQHFKEEKLAEQRQGGIRGDQVKAKGVLSAMTADGVLREGGEKTTLQGPELTNVKELQQQQQVARLRDHQPTPVVHYSASIPSSFTRPLGGIMAGPSYRSTAAGEALEAGNCGHGSYGGSGTQDSLVVSTCWADTQDGTAGAVLGLPGVNAELDMVEDWGSAAKNSRDDSDQTASEDTRPPYVQEGRLYGCSTSGDAGCAGAFRVYVQHSSCWYKQHCCQHRGGRGTEVQLYLSTRLWCCRWSLGSWRSS
jgi:hypothetical protein